MLAQAQQADPLNPWLYRAVAAEHRSRGDELGALAHALVADVLTAWQPGADVAQLEPLFTVATGYFMKGDDAQAARFYEVLLRLCPSHARSLQNLAVLHDRAGRPEEGQAMRERAYALQRVYVELVAKPQRRLLILYAGRTSGHVPVEPLLSAGRTKRIKYAIDCAAPQEDHELPDHDLVFNAIGDADAAEASADRVAQFWQINRRPWLNQPNAVQRTRRDRLASSLAGVPGLVVADCHRLECLPKGPDPWDEVVSRLRLDWPILVRPLASHGGRGLVRMNRAQDGFEGPCEMAHYLTRFIDTRSADGFYRKYRVVLVDGRVLPYHLAISKHWMVHYFSADMPAHQWKLQEEERFLQHPAQVLGDGGLQALHSLGERLGLDYVGVDFSVLPDGSIFVFEANATMLVHPERPDGILAFKTAAFNRIALAFEAMLARRWPGSAI